MVYPKQKERPPAGLSYRKRLHWYFDNGVRPGSSKWSKWKVTALAETIGVDDRTVGFWFQRDVRAETEVERIAKLANLETQIPNHGNHLQVMKAFFGASDQIDDWARQEIEEFGELFVTADAHRQARQADKAFNTRQNGRQRKALGTTSNRSSKIAQGVSTNNREPNGQPVSNIPLLSLGELFHGRENALSQLQAVFDDEGSSPQPVVAALVGTAGIGKTRLAIEFASRSATKWSGLFFVRSSSSGEFNDSIAALAGIIGLPEGEISSVDAKSNAVLRWLRQNHKWLMIIDNIDDPATLKHVIGIISSLPGGAILLTGRYARLPGGVRKTRLTALSISSGREFLLDRTRDDRVVTGTDQQDASELSAAMGGLPLALEQAAAFICVSHVSIKEYFGLWQRNSRAVLEWFDDGAMSYDHGGAAAAWLTSFERLSQKAKSLIGVVAHFDDSPIPTSIFGEFDADAQGDRKALTELYDFSLATPEGSAGATNPSFLVHRVIQLFARRRMTEEQMDTAIDQAFKILTTATGYPDGPPNWGANYDLGAHFRSRDSRLVRHLKTVAKWKLGRGSARADTDPNKYLYDLCYTYCYLDQNEAQDRLATAIIDFRSRGGEQQPYLFGFLQAIYAALARTEPLLAIRASLMIEAATTFIRAGLTDLLALALARLVENTVVIDDGTASALDDLSELAAASSNDHAVALAGILLGPIESPSPRLVSSLNYLAKRGYHELCGGVLSRRLIHNKNDETGFASNWRFTCEFCSVNSWDVNALYAGTSTLAQNFPRLFAHDFAKDIVEILRDYGKRHVPLFEGWDAVASRIRITQMEAPPANTIAEFFAYRSDDGWKGQPDARFDAVRSIFDLLTTAELAWEVREIVALEAAKFGVRGRASRLALALLASRLMSEGRLQDARDAAMASAVIAQSAAIADGHAAVVEAKGLLAELGVSEQTDIAIEKPDFVPANLAILDRYPRISMSILINAKGRAAITVDGWFEDNPKYISYVRRYVTFHFSKLEPYTVDYEVEEALNALIRSASKLFVIRGWKGVAIEAFETDLLVDRWPSQDDLSTPTDP